MTMACAASSSRKEITVVVIGTSARNSDALSACMAVGGGPFSLDCLSQSSTRIKASAVQPAEYIQVRNWSSQSWSAHGCDAT